MQTIDESTGKIIEDRALMPVSQVESWLATKPPVEEAQELINRARAAASYYRAKHDVSAHNEAVEIQARAERYVGARLKEMPKATGGQPYQSTNTTAVLVEQPPTLKELNITNNQSSRMQQLAEIPTPIFEETIQELKREPEKVLTKAAIFTVVAQKSQRMGATVYSSESNEWYTPAWITALARQAMGGIDLDPASSQAAQSIHAADSWYGLDHPDLDRRDGFTQMWYGCVWLNPPYGRSDDGHNAQLWSEKLVTEYEDGRVEAGIILVKAALGYNWFEDLWCTWPTCLLRERLSFVRPDGADEGQSKQGTALIYIGDKIDRFRDVFRPYGRIVLPDPEGDA